MANYQSLKTAINAVIKANGNKEITGTVLNEVLLAMVNSLGAGYQFAGVATPSTNPGTPDQKVFYIASQAGTYTNFGGAVVSDGIAIFEWNDTWTTETLDLPVFEQVQSDWTEDDTTKKSYIKHKPNIPEEQVQSDWTETDTTKKSYIKHKPNIPPSANVDPVPTEDSPNAVSSGGVYDVTHGTLKTRYIPFDLREESIIFLSDEDMTELFGPATMVGDQSMFDLTVGQYQHVYRVTNSKSEVFEIPAAYNNANGARKIVGINGNLTIELSFTITNGVYVNAAIAKRETSIPGISYEEEQDLTPAQRRTAQQNIGLEKDVAGGVAGLDGNGKIVEQQIPTDVVDGANLGSTSVQFGAAQQLTPTQQVNAQNNMMGKDYSSVAADHTGLGKVYLDKNNGVLTQAMMQATNTVYVIQYDYTLDGNITVPAGCILEFDGGSISSGGTGKDTITGNNILLAGELTKAIRTNLKGVFLTNRQLYEDVFAGMTDVQKQENSKKINNSIVASNPNGGWYNTGVAGTFVVGNTNLPKAAVCGFSEQTLTSYKGRDSVALYSEVDSLPYVAFENGTFSLDHVTFPANVDLHEVVEGNYIDVLYNSNRFTSIVDYVDLSTNTIYVKFGGFHNISTGNKEVPPVGSVTYINRITKLWALNTNVVCENNNNSVEAITGYELGIFLNKENVDATGIDIVSLGRVQPAIAMRASGFLVGLRSSNIPTMIQRLYKVDDSVSYEEDTFNYKMLESWGTKQSDGTYHHIASLDKDFNIENDYAPVKVKSRNTYIQVNGQQQRIITNAPLYNSEGEMICHFKPYRTVNQGVIKVVLSNPVNVINKYYVEIYTDDASMVSSFMLDVYYVSNAITKIDITPIQASYIDGELMVGYDATGVYIKRAGTIKSISALKGASEISVSASQYPSGVENKYFYKSGSVIPTSNIIPKGFMFFYGTKPIWYTGDTSGGKSGWVDATGTDVPNTQS